VCGAGKRPGTARRGEEVSESDDVFVWRRSGTDTPWRGEGVCFDFRRSPAWPSGRDMEERRARRRGGGGADRVGSSVALDGRREAPGRWCSLSWVNTKRGDERFGSAVGVSGARQL
jgi:hypothetical protein